MTTFRVNGGRSLETNEEPGPRLLTAPLHGAVVGPALRSCLLSLPHRARKAKGANDTVREMRQRAIYTSLHSIREG